MKFWNYIILSVGLALLFELAGIPIATSLLNTIGVSVDTGLSVKSASLYLAIFGVGGILIGITAGIIIGAITRTPPENYIILPIIIGTGTLFLAPFVSIANYAINNYDGWIAYPTLFLMTLLSIGFVWSMVEFFRGTD